MAYFKNIPGGHDGKIIYNGSIINGIVLLAISEIDGVEMANITPNQKNKSDDKLSKKAVRVRFEKDGIHVDVDVQIHQLSSVSDMAFKIQENVKHNVEAMTEYHIAKVNVNVVGVMFDEDPTNNVNNQQ